jgi:hypothetical protein
MLRPRVHTPASALQAAARRGDPLMMLDWNEHRKQTGVAIDIRAGAARIYPARTLDAYAAKAAAGK